MPFFKSLNRMKPVEKWAAYVLYPAWLAVPIQSDFVKYDGEKP